MEMRTMGDLLDGVALPERLRYRGDGGSGLRVSESV
jgi:hypothetical protein